MIVQYKLLKISLVNPCKLLSSFLIKCVATYSKLLFNCKNMSSQALNDELNKRNICVRSGLHCSPLGHKAIKGDTKGAVRVSFGVFNTSKDVFDFVDALWDITQKK